MKMTMYFTLLTALIGLSSNSFMTLWLMLEINSPMFAMFMISYKEKPINPMTYLIVQAMPSLIFLTLISYILTKNLISPKTSNMNCFLSLISFMKMGMAPFHNWMMKLMKTLKTKSILLLLTVQKILPLKILSYSMNNNFTLMMILLNIFLSNYLILTSNKTNIILMSSSMFNLSWIIFNLNLSLKMSIMYFSIYSILTMKLVMKFYNLTFKSTNLKDKNINLELIIMILAISGIPPMWGFLSKMMLINIMLNFHTPNLMIFTLLMTSIFMLYGYLKIITPMILKNLKSSKNLTMKTPWFITLNILTPLSISLM